MVQGYLLQAITYYKPYEPTDGVPVFPEPYIRRVNTRLPYSKDVVQRARRLAYRVDQRARPIGGGGGQADQHQACH